MDKRYNTFSAHLKRIFGCKVQRISIDAGFSCPNRDGTLGSKGCIFCGGRGSGSFGIKPELPIALQLEDGKALMRRKYHADKFIAYFQPYTNTYADLSVLRQRYEEALSVPDVVGLIIATRPDCLDDSKYDYLSELDITTYFWLEIGMQSMHDKSLEFINRQHDFRATQHAIKAAVDRGIKVCAHVILGLPGETRTDMLETAEMLNLMRVNGVKIHLLHVMKNTGLETHYRERGLVLMDRDEYVGTVCDFLERLNPEIIIHRLTGDGGHDNLVAPLWSLKKFEVLNLIDKELTSRGTAQGARCGAVEPRIL